MSLSPMFKRIMIVALVIMAISMTVSAYSMGRNWDPKKKETGIFKSGIAFLVIGWFFFVVIVGFLYWFTECDANEKTFQKVFGIGGGGGTGNRPYTNSIYQQQQQQPRFPSRPQFVSRRT